MDTAVNTDQSTSPLLIQPQTYMRNRETCPRRWNFWMALPPILGDTEQVTTCLSLRERGWKQMTSNL